MKLLSVNELSSINAGASLSLVLGLIGAATFIIGIIDGLMNPLKCRK